VPRLDGYRAVLFDLDGVLTPTADLHMSAWRTLFEAVFAEKGVREPYTDDDYFDHLDGRKRDDGVADVLASRGIRLERGEPTDPPTADTVWGIGNRKNAVFTQLLEEQGIAPYPASLAVVERLQAEGVPMAVVSSSKNARKVLEAAGLLEHFPVIVDGNVAGERKLRSKPEPDMFLEGARELGVEAADAVVLEDATSGVAAGRAGNFGLVVGVDRGTGEQALLDSGADLVVQDLAEFEEASR
jgi:beta-phosphoglucomutase family hydrolase